MATLGALNVWTYILFTLQRLKRSRPQWGFAAHPAISQHVICFAVKDQTKTKYTCSFRHAIDIKAYGSWPTFPNHINILHGLKLGHQLTGAGSALTDYMASLTRRGRMIHTCVSKLDHHWFRWCLACPMPLSEPMLVIVSCTLKTKFQKQMNIYISSLNQENALQNGGQLNLAWMCQRKLKPLLLPWRIWQPPYSLIALVFHIHAFHFTQLLKSEDVAPR